MPGKPLACFSKGGFLSALCLPLPFRLLVCAEGVLSGTCRDWSDVGRGCLGLTSWEQGRERLKYNKQGEVHFQSRQGSRGERVFAAGEATPYLLLTWGLRVLPTALPASQRVRGWASESR